jgi:predicted esterase
MGNQIDYFKTKYRVVIADRGQGKSELKTDSLTYAQITREDGLVNYLKLDSISIVGWSDGGIIGLEMGVSVNQKIKKIVAMGANLRPDSTAVNSWAINNVMKERVLVESKLKKRHYSRLEITKQLLGLLGD